MYWIIGKEGQLAQTFQHLFSEKGSEFIATGRHDIELSNRSIDRFLKQHSIATIINTAAYTKVDLAEDEPKQAAFLNAGIPKALAIASKSYGIKCLHFSTDYVFDGKKQQPYTESDKPNPLNVYGQTKLEGERALLDINPKALVIRSSWLFSPYGHNFVKTIIRLLKEKPVLTIVSDQFGNPTSCYDLARSSLELQEQQGLYHYASPSTISWYEFAVAIKESLETLGERVVCKEILPIETKNYPQKAIRPSYSALNTAKIEKVLGKSAPTFKLGLETLVKSILEKDREISRL